ncbi:MAG: hypothetical protein EBT15_12290 [Betaproteobacteria bacterium]|nr:hypothetical protein [Betaproteobacteria bacterium]
MNHPEKWLPVVGWEGLYSVSNLGRVRSEPRLVTRCNGRKYPLKGKMLSPTTNSWGYMQVGLRRPGYEKKVHVHQLVAESFIGPRPVGQETRHGAGGKLDNRLVNLSYGTHAENEADKLRDGTRVCGTKHPFTKLTVNDIHAIRSETGQRPQREVAAKYGIAQTHVSKIQAKKIWASVPDALEQEAER